MNRDFLIEEVMLDGVSGEVAGTVSVDTRTGTVERVACDHFRFQDDSSDRIVSLDKTRLVNAMEIVDRVLAQDSELGDGSGCYFASAARFIPSPVASSASVQALSRHLETVDRASAPDRALAGRAAVDENRKFG